MKQEIRQRGREHIARGKRSLLPVTLSKKIAFVPRWALPFIRNQIAAQKHARFSSPFTPYAETLLAPRTIALRCRDLRRDRSARSPGFAHVFFHSAIRVVPLFSVEPIPRREKRVLLLFKSILHMILRFRYNGFRVGTDKPTQKSSYRSRRRHCTFLLGLAGED